jgi:hypothetical protein
MACDFSFSSARAVFADCLARLPEVGIVALTRRHPSIHGTELGTGSAAMASWYRFRLLRM